MSTATYAINPFTMLLTDDTAASDLLLHDLPRDDEKLQAQALVASGDYFEMLAAELEQIATVLPVHCMEQYQLQYYIGQLLYLQRHYKIVKRSHS